MKKMKLVDYIRHHRHVASKGKDIRKYTVKGHREQKTLGNAHGEEFFSLFDEMFGLRPLSP